MHLHRTHEEEHALAVVNSLQITITNTGKGICLFIVSVVNSLQITITNTADSASPWQCGVVNSLQITITNTMFHIDMEVE